MAPVGRRDGRNFGYGRQLSYAGPQALKDLFGGGHYGTVKAHSDRWQAFVRWCQSEEGPGFNDARQIDRQTLLDYAGNPKLTPPALTRYPQAFQTAHKLSSKSRFSVSTGVAMIAMRHHKKGLPTCSLLRRSCHRPLTRNRFARALASNPTQLNLLNAIKLKTQEVINVYFAWPSQPARQLSKRTRSCNQKLCG